MPTRQSPRANGGAGANGTSDSEQNTLNHAILKRSPIRALIQDFDPIWWDPTNSYVSHCWKRY